MKIGEDMYIDMKRLVYFKHPLIFIYFDDVCFNCVDVKMVGYEPEPPVPEAEAATCTWSNHHTRTRYTVFNR